MNIESHHMSDEHPQQAGKEQAEEKVSVRFAKSGYKKYTYRNVHRPSNDLAPPISRNLIKHTFTNLLGCSIKPSLHFTNGQMLG
jgi:hypothetical protein